MASKTENRRVNLYINGKEVKGSIKGITAEFKKLTAEQKDMTIGTKEYQAHAKKINRLKAVMDQHHQSINRTAGAWGSLQKAANGFNKYFMMITAGIATLTGLVMAFRKAADAANIFEERLDNLSALTGLEGKSLEWLGDKAKETSVAILEAGGHSIRIKQSASDIVDAYTKMGSQRPELLKNKELLHETTMNAIILSEAAKGKLEPSVSALATTLNQFNYAADQSNRVINTIASGSKAGAANIDYLSTAVEQSGTTMALMGMQVEQGIAIIEAVAPKFKKATKAGNSLDKVFLKMRTNNIGYVNGVFDINTALDELRVRFDKGESAVDIFGERHAKMVEVMVQGQSEYNRYLDLVTDSDIAFEQAAKNTDNRATTLAQAKNKITLLAIELGEKLSPAMTKAYLGFGMLMKVTMALPKIFKENKTLILLLTGAYLAYNAQKLTNIALSIKETAHYYGLIAAEKIRFVLGTKGLVLTNAIAIAAKTRIAVTGKMTIAQGRAIIAQKSLNATMKANPLGLILIGITALITGIRLYNKYNAKALELERKKKDLAGDLTTVNNSLSDSYTTINKQISVLNRMSYQEKIDLQDKIDQTIQLAEAELALAKIRRNEIRESIDPSLWDEFTSAAKSWWVELTQGENAGNEVWGDLLYEAVEKDRDEATKEIDEFMAEIEDNLDNIKNSTITLSDILNAESIGDSIGSGTFVELEEKLNQYQIALNNTLKTSEAYLRIQNKISATEKAMKSFNGDYDTKKEQAEAARLAAEKVRVEKQLADAIKQIRRKLNLDTLSDQEKEIQQVEYKYQDLIAKADKYGLDIKVLKQLQEEEIAAIEKKWGDKKAEEKQKAQDKIAQILASDRELAIIEATKKYQDLIKLAEEFKIDTTELYQAMNDELAAIQDQTFGDEDAPKDIFGMSPGEWDEMIAHVQAAIEIARQFGEVWAASNAATVAQENAAMLNYEASMDRRRELYEDQLQAGIISQQRFNQLSEDLDTQLDNRKKKLAIEQFEREKEIRLYSAIINTAGAIVQALNSGPPPYNFIMAGITAVLGGVQVAKIANEPTPAFKYGGYTPNRPTQVWVGDGNKTEWVASGDLVEDPVTGPIIQQLEDYQQGHANSFRFSPPVQPDFDSISSSSPQLSYGSTSASLDSELLAGIHQQMMLMNQNNEKMNNYLSDPKNRRSTISYDHLHEYEEELSDIQALSRTSA